ncbi:hypothetical protein [Pararhizobium sp. DWP3-4]|uniref:hypothetical protein n=1 Tax=Pararhizobium sp. DWP3-4 TaxID=2804565 RepID=UPI003CE8D2D8
MSCLIPLLEEQIDLLRKQVKDAGLSHDAQHAKITLLEAENARLREKLYPQPPIMEGTFVPTESTSDAGGDGSTTGASGENKKRQA